MQRIADATLEDDLRTRYGRDGFVVLPRLFPSARLNAIRRDVGRVFAARRDGQMKDPDIDGSLEDLMTGLFTDNFAGYHGAARLCNHLISLHRLSLSEEIVENLILLGLDFPAVCARPVMWFHSPRVAKTERYHRLPAHQEWSNMQGSLDGAVAWMPLVPVSPDMGRLQVVPGSHRRGLLPFGKDETKDYPLSIAPDKVNDVEFVEVDVPLGGALIFSAFLIHRSGTNRSDKVRLTVNFRYNNAAEPTFIARDFLNPFLYAVPEELKTPGFPTAEQVRTVFEKS